MTKRIETIVYKDNRIHVFDDGNVYAYVMNEDGDIEEIHCASVNKAMEAINSYYGYNDSETD